MKTKCSIIENMKELASVDVINRAMMYYYCVSY